jgi:hypothetical protein
VPGPGTPPLDAPELPLDEPPELAPELPLDPPELVAPELAPLLDDDAPLLPPHASVAATTTAHATPPNPIAIFARMLAPPPQA